ncbi:MAG: hypothetical protein ACQEQL_08845 [Pseudomonadota bacterium]
MTSEIIVMNKNGIALAADSAATLLPSRKTYHTQNKIFSLSKQHPVGIMIHEKLRLNGIPWETIIKMYRTQHNNCGFNTAEAYLEHLIDFISNCEALFDREHSDLYWTCDILCYLETLGRKIETSWHDSHQNGQAETVSLMQFGNRYIEQQIEILSHLHNAPQMSGKKIRDQLNTALDNLSPERIDQCFGLYPLRNEARTQIRELLYLLTIKNDFSLGYSGVVLAGFGETDIFPVVATAKLGGFYFGQVKYDLDPPVRISHQNQAQIIPFASTEMVSTFIKGVHPDYETYSLAETHKTMENLVKAVGCYLDIPETTANQAIFDQLIEDYFQQYKYKLVHHILNSHIQPVVDGIRFLPKDALASVAESLVNVASFKTSVMPHENFIGGDIDVALISKGDGFIWIKRKDYFDPDKNLDFLDRDMSSSQQ